jgi:hypothetical protein
VKRVRTRDKINSNRRRDKKRRGKKGEEGQTKSNKKSPKSRGSPMVF